MECSIKIHGPAHEIFILTQGSHRLEKYLNLECFFEKSLKIKSALKSTGNLSKALKSPLILIFFVGLNSTVDKDLNLYKIFVPLFGAAYWCRPSRHPVFSFPHSTEPVGGFWPNLHRCIVRRMKSLLDFGDLDLIFKVTPVLFNVKFWPELCFPELNDWFQPYYYIFVKLGKMSQNLSSAAVGLAL